METLLFLVMFVVASLVIHWYVANAAATSDGAFGLLKIRPQGSTESGETQTSHRPKTGRIAMIRGIDLLSRRERAVARGGMTPAFKAGPRGDAFQDKEEAAYRSRDPLPRFNTKPPRGDNP